MHHRTICGLMTLGLLWTALPNTADVASAQERLKWKISGAQAFREYDLPAPSGKAIREKTPHGELRDERGKGSAFYGNLLLVPGRPLAFASATRGHLVKMEPSLTGGILYTEANLDPQQRVGARLRYLLVELQFSSFDEASELGTTEYLLRYQLFDNATNRLGSPVAYYQRGRSRRMLVFEGDFSDSAEKNFAIEDMKGGRLELSVDKP